MEYVLVNWVAPAVIGLLLVMASGCIGFFTAQSIYQEEERAD